MVELKPHPRGPWDKNREINMGAMGGFGVFLAVLAVVVALLWIFLPFAVFGIKDLAKSLIEEQKRTNALLTELAAQSKLDRPPAVVERKNWA